MAFLHRVENGGGVLNREYAVRCGRLDLCLRLGLDRVTMERTHSEVVTSAGGRRITVILA